MAVLSQIHDRLDRARKELLDLSPRNRLVHTPLDSSRSKILRIFDEVSEHVFRTLVRNGKSMSFLPGKELSNAEDGVTDAEALLAQPEDDEIDEDGVPARHTDNQLQTAISSESLQKKLLGIYYDAKTFEEEQGVNILYLALGFVQWYESPSSEKPRYAPLVLIPVELQRQSVGSRFRLHAGDHDLQTNLSLQAKLDGEFGVKLPDLPVEDDWEIAEYFQSVSKAIAGQSRWKVLSNEIVLGFFSFSKFLMYRDLDSATWKNGTGPASHPLVVGLIEGGLTGDRPFCGDDEKIDAHIAPAEMIHVVDCDSSQAVAIEEVRRGRNLVIQGPPGTGKSQTIANLIAAAVKDGKTVLFVAEKMAALEVVKRRLDAVGLGNMCLELHSHKVNKRIVAEELGRTLELGRPKGQNPSKLIVDLTHVRDQANRYVEELHRSVEPSGRTPYQIIGELVRLQRLGVAPPDFRIENARDWTSAEFRRRNELVNDVVLHWQHIGKPDEHHWRGVGLSAVLATDVSRLMEQIKTAIKLLDETSKLAVNLGQKLRVRAGDSALNNLALINLGKHLAAAPPMDRTSLAHRAWHERRDEISEIVAGGKKLAETQSRLKEVVADVAWTTDLANTRRDLAAHGRSWFCWLNRDYRQAQATLRGVFVAPPPNVLDQKLELLDCLISGQRILWEVNVQQSTAELGKEAFGSYWRGSNSDWQVLGAIDAWERECREAKLPPNFRQIFAGIDDARAIGTAVSALSTKLKEFFEFIKVVLHSLKFDLKKAFGKSYLREISLTDIRSRLVAWQADPEALSKWINFRTRWERLAVDGLTPLAEEIYQRKISPESAANRFGMAYYEELLRAVYKQSALLREFNGESHAELLERFRGLDQQRIQAARYEVALSHYQRIPNDGGEIGEVGIIRREVSRKRAHKPLRRLLAEAGHAVQATKPVLMMSPISVAQFLEPGILSFDLLLIDEASQVKPVDALGAIARSRQIVVVGDDKQLPPTRFFDSFLGDDSTDDPDQDFSAGDVESILKLCCAQGLPTRMLRWHYRSKHHSLIAVSNREFYENRLYVIPSPTIESADMGLRFRHIADAVFDRGESATNRIEARAVAHAVMEHVRLCPELSLGVGAFSVAQRDAILDELELLRRANSEMERFFATGGAEPFFVKNLENIQGDERDVIFISVGYGRDSSGFMSMSFGPLQTDGGERRLNVLISRAKRRCEVFSSITADDIDLSRARSRGAAALKTFLSYAQRGILDIDKQATGNAGSEFEEEVAHALARLGFDVASQIGVAGFFIDLAIRDQDQPGRYLLGIECDGATYHSSRSARDRDRLRQQVLEDRGWCIHRIWSSDWFQRRDEQLRRVVAAIENARVPISSQEATANGRVTADAVQVSGLDREATLPDVETLATIRAGYTKALFTVSESRPIHEIGLAELAKYVIKVVQVEGPVHQDEIARRLVELWGGQRTSKRTSEAVAEAVEFAIQQKQLTQDGYFCQCGGQTVIVRNRCDVDSSSLRKPEMLPPAEIQKALFDIVQVHLGVLADEAIVECARLLGFASTSAQLRDVIAHELKKSLAAGIFVERQNKIYVR